MKIEGKLSTEKIQAYLLRFQQTHMHEQTKKRQKDRQANVQAYRQIDRHKYVDYMQYA